MKTSAVRTSSTSLHINVVRVMKTMRRHGQDARECAGADGNHQQQTDTNREVRGKSGSSRDKIRHLTVEQSFDVLFR